MKIKIKTESGHYVLFAKEKTDPICMRMSIGGTPEIGYYNTFKGDNFEEMESMLEDVLETFKKARIKYLENCN